MPGAVARSSWCRSLRDDAPGTRLRAIAARLCRARTMERLIDPTIADLQAEYEDSVSRGRKWKARRVWIVGHLALIRVVVVHASVRTTEILRDSRDDDHRPVRQTLLATAIIMAVGTLALLLPFLGAVPATRLHTAELAIYLIPQALPLSIPVGLTFGILWGLGRVPASYRSRILILSLAVVASIASFTLLAWVVPMANQAYRVSVVRVLALRGQPIGHPPAKGPRELTLGELRAALETTTPDADSAATHSRTHILALEFHKKWALGSAPLALAFFAVALSSRRRWGRTMPLFAGSVAIVGYYAVMLLAIDPRTHVFCVRRRVDAEPHVLSPLARNHEVQLATDGVDSDPLDLQPSLWFRADPP